MSGDLDQHEEITAALNALADDSDPEQVATVTRQYVNDDMITAAIARAAAGGGGGSQPVYWQDDDPGAVGSGKLWIDTTELELKMRNGDDDGWGQLYVAGVEADGPVRGSVLQVKDPPASPGDVTVNPNTGGAVRDFVVVAAEPPTDFVGMVVVDNTPATGGCYVWSIGGGSGVYIQIAGPLT